MSRSSPGAAPTPAFWSGTRVVVTGGAGFLGRPTVALLRSLGAAVEVVRSNEHDLRDPRCADDALAGAEVVIHLAATVGGIGLNRRAPGSLARDNLLMAANVFEAARVHGVAKLVAAGSMASYPRQAPIPFREQDLWLGYPDPSHAPYGLAKRMLGVLSDAYRSEFGLDSCAPVLVNLYGPGDDYGLEDSHVVGAMIRKFVDAERERRERVVLWGTGEPTREFLYVDDAARAVVLAAERYSSSEPLNIGTGKEVRIRELAELVARLSGYRGETVWDSERPDGQPRRVLDVSRARELLGFEAEVGLERGLALAIEDFRERAEAEPGALR